MERKPYTTDLTDEQWATVEPSLPPAKAGGRPRKTDLREVVNAILYINRNGCTCGSQTVKTTEMGGERGYDGGKKIKGRKRHITVDTIGLLLAVVVTSAAVDDGDAAPDVFACMESEAFPRLQKIWADRKYHNHALYEWMHENVDYEWEIVSRPDDAKGFVVLHRRWVVERTIAWLNRARRLSKDYERRTDTSEAMLKISMIHLMVNRLAPKVNTSPFHYEKANKKAA